MSETVLGSAAWKLVSPSFVTAVSNGVRQNSLHVYDKVTDKLLVYTGV